MKIGILVHSQTGNTLSVAQKLMEKLSSAGNTLTLERLSPVGGENVKEKDITKIKVETYPDLEAYDSLIICGPVWGANMSNVMSAYLSQVTSLKGKKVACFVTEFFPFAWMGGNHAVTEMKRSCEAKGASVIATAVVNWASLRRAKSIETAVEILSKSFT